MYYRFGKNAYKHFRHTDKSVANLRNDMTNPIGGELERREERCSLPSLAWALGPWLNEEVETKDKITVGNTIMYTIGYAFIERERPNAFSVIRAKFKL